MTYKVAKIQDENNPRIRHTDGGLKSAYGEAVNEDRSLEHMGERTLTTQQRSQMQQAPSRVFSPFVNEPRTERTD